MKISLTGLSKFDFLGVLLLRLGSGATIAFHGFPLFVGGPDAWKGIGAATSLIGINSFYLFLGLASAMIQTFGGLALIVGLFTRGVSILLSIVMAFAIGQMVQDQEPLFNVFIAAQLSLVYLALVFIGPGRLSLDRKGI